MVLPPLAYSAPTVDDEKPEKPLPQRPGYPFVSIPPRKQRAVSTPSPGTQWDTTNPFATGDSENTSPTTPADSVTAQQRLRSDSAGSTITADYEYAPYNCPSRDDVHMPRTSWLTISLIILGVYSTAMSGLWLVVSLVQPRWGHAISSTSGRLAPSTASLLTTLFAKSIEMSFVTVFVAFIGQVLSRRAFVKARGGVTLAEINMRNWVIQPGSLLTQWDTVSYAGLTFLGALSLAASLTATLYTTASDAMVTPKLKFGSWEEMEMAGFVRSSYANPFYVRANCPTPFTTDLDPEGGAACLDVEYSGRSYHNLLAFMEIWQTINSNGTNTADDVNQRPDGTAMLHDNTTMTSAWIDVEHSNVTRAFNTFGRLINNVTLAMPHPGVYSAATNQINGLLQPQDLSGVGEYTIRASVVSPAVNVLCVNLDKSELSPLVYTTWPSAQLINTSVPGQLKGFPGWERDVPAFSETEFLNATVVDDLFRWGSGYGRRPPVFQMFPLDSNTLTNTTVRNTDAIYVLGKSPAPTMEGNYTLCEMRSWMTTSCSTRFSISGTEGIALTAHCEDPDEVNTYSRMHPELKVPKPSRDWKNMVDQWRLAIGLNGGINNNNASNARILTGLALNELPVDGKDSDSRLNTAGLPALLPTMAEALAVFVASTLVIGAIDTPFGAEDWAFAKHELGAPGAIESFNASIRSQEFVSGHTEMWQAVVFYPVLVFMFLINFLCLFYLASSLLGERGWNWGRALLCCCRDRNKAGSEEESCNDSGFVTDYTETANLFALAINSPPSRQLAGSCGAGPQGRDLVIPWRVGWNEKGNHYYFEEASDVPRRGRWRDVQAGGARSMGTSSSYRNLSISKSWL